MKRRLSSFRCKLTKIVHRRVERVRHTRKVGCVEKMANRITRVAQVSKKDHVETVELLRTSDEEI